MAHENIGTNEWLAKAERSSLAHVLHNACLVNGLQINKQKNELTQAKAAYSDRQKAGWETTDNFHKTASTCSQLQLGAFF